MSKWISSLWNSLKKVLIGKTTEISLSVHDPQPAPDKQKKVGSGQAVDFKNFLAIPVSLPTKVSYTQEERKKISISIAEAILEAFQTKTLDFPVELYMARQIAGKFFDIFGFKDHKEKFLECCEGRLFSAPMSLASISPSAKRLIFYERILDYHPFFDSVLGQQFIVRPLENKVSVPHNSSAVSPPKGGQLLLGLLEIKEGNQFRREETIWFWRGLDSENRISLHLDFDLLSKALPQELHKFPLGCELKCTVFTDYGGTRSLEEVSFDIAELKRWIRHVQGKVDYLAAIGGGQFCEGLHLHDDSIVIPREGDPFRDFDLGRGMKVPINRIFGLMVKTSTETWTYWFAFFKKAVSYTPEKNIMRVVGQLIPAGAETFVALPPGSQITQPESVFCLNPGKTFSDRFTITAKPYSEYEIRVNNTAIKEGDPIEIEIGKDKVEVQPHKDIGTEDRIFRFELLDATLLVPPEILNSATQEGRPYGALLRVTSPEERSLQLTGREYIFGKGRRFPKEAFGINEEALKILRPYNRIEVYPVGNQRVWLVDKDESTKPGVPSKAAQLSKGGEMLKLNGDYEIYLGDYQISLDLSPTPTFL